MQLLFCDHTLDPDRRELRRGSEPIAVEPQVFDLLIHLIRNRDRVVSKDDLIASVWDGRIVSESTLTSRINAARKAIGDSGEEQKLIRTIARRGFRFVGEVRMQSKLWRTGRYRRPTMGRTPRAVTPSRATLGSSRHRRASLREHERRSRAGIFFRRHQRGHDHRAIQAALVLRDRTQLFVHLQGQVRPYEAGRRRTRRRLCGRGQRAQERRPGGITVQLNDAATGSHIWAEHYDRHLVDVFAVQDEITEAIVAAIEPQLYASESFRAQRKPPDNMDAWDLVMRALSHYWRVTREDSVVAQALLEKAIAIDPNYGQALGVLATSYTFSFHMGWADRATAVPIAERAALAAIRADSEDPWAHHALRCVYLLTRRFDDSLAEFELALRLNPNFSLAQGFYGLALSYCSRWEEADRAARRALRLSPRDPFSAIFTGIAAYAQFVGRNYAEAMRLAREAIRQRSDFVGAHRVLTAAAGMAGHSDVAAAALQELRRAQPNISLGWIANEMPVMQGSELEHYLEAFRRAGLK